MSVRRKIFYNTLTQSIGKVIAVALGLFSVGLLTRYLQESGFGQYSTILAFMGVVVVFADLGLYLIVTREISKPDTNHYKVISNALGLRLVSAGLLLLAGALLALLFPYEPIVKQTMFVGIGAYLFISLNQVLIGIFQKHLVQYLSVISEVLGRALNLLLIYLFVQNQLSLPFFILSLTLGNGLNFLLGLLFAKRFENFSIEFDFRYWKKILTASWPLAFAVILNLLYFKTDTIILSVFQPQEAVGVYSLPYKILEVLLAFPAMFVGLIMPILSRTAFTEQEKFKSIFQKSFDALVLLAIPMVITTWFFADPIINLIKGQGNFADSPDILRLLIFATAIIFTGTLFGYTVVAVDQQKKMIKGYLLSAIVGLLLYFTLIPRFSYWGAAAGTVVTELVVMLAAYYFIRKKISSGLSLKIFLLALPASAAMILFHQLISLQWIVEAVLGLVIYSALLIVFRAVPLDFIRAIIFVKSE